MILLNENEQNKGFNFLDVKVVRELIFNDVYTYFDNYLLLNCKFSLVPTIIFRTFTICSDMPKFHQEIFKVKDIFMKKCKIPSGNF